MSIKYNSNIDNTIEGSGGQPGLGVGAYGAWGNHTSTVYEPQRLNNFEFFVDFSDGDGFDSDTKQNQVLSDAIGSNSNNIENELRLAVKSAFIPHFTQEVITVKRGNSTLRYAGTADFDQGSLTIHDFIGAKAKEILMAWQALSYNVDTEKVGLAQHYKKTAKLLEYSPDYQLVRSWTLYGCWISKLSEGTYDYDGGQNSTNDITVEIAYDKAVVDDTANAGQAFLK